MEKPLSFEVSRTLANLEATEQLGAELALFLRPGDVIALSGDLGAGKTSLARTIIRALAPDAGLFDVPSPTFTLVQPYEFTRIPVNHFDFYRLSSEDEAVELGFDDREDVVVIAEWPERVAGLLPDERLEVELADASPGSRKANLRGHGEWANRLTRMGLIAEFLENAGLAQTGRRFLMGDASARRYESLSSDPPMILMDSPAQPDGPPIRDGKPYSQIAHLAENVTAFAAVAQGLRDAGLSAPQIYESDLDNGILLIEDFGNDVFGHMITEGQHDMDEPYQMAVKALVEIAEAQLPEGITLPGGELHRVPPFDQGALEIEVELLLDWYWPSAHGAVPSAEQREEYLTIWRKLWPKLKTHPPVWVLRDYHSPNLLWMADREGVNRLGIIDFQDAMLGHPAYDLTSLLQDARIDVPKDRQKKLLADYIDLRTQRSADFDEAAFLTAFHIMGAQRISKILGIFMRLKVRDGKPGYLRHMPRLWWYLEDLLQSPDLSDLKAWYDTYFPPETRERVKKGA
ncbi:MAG: tRNA (adenosine(37)-N6)-threonylcarbamoyltransferase complex ATPase subunit type 1 TsaE [Hyphomicrobiales bacterium]